MLALEIKRLEDIHPELLDADRRLLLVLKYCTTATYSYCYEKDIYKAKVLLGAAAGISMIGLSEVLQEEHLFGFQGISRQSPVEGLQKLLGAYNNYHCFDFQEILRFAEDFEFSPLQCLYLFFERFKAVEKSCGATKIERSCREEKAEDLLYLNFCCDPLMPEFNEGLKYRIESAVDKINHRCKEGADEVL